MARHIYRGEVWEYYFWPIRVGTPHWFDNAKAEYRPRRSGGFDRVWAVLRSWRVIRVRRVAQAEAHLAGGASDA